MLLEVTEPGQSSVKEPCAPAIGIDLGTTHSVVAVVEEGYYKVLPVNGSEITPSVVALGDTVQVGEAAKAHKHAIHSIKRSMGVSGEEAGQRKAVEVSAEILKALKAGAEEALGQEVSKAVITVPAYFSENARTATKDAARLAGLEVLRLINEPTAAALAYGLDESAEGIYVVYDFGGGTFDISILDMQKGVFRVLATGGDTQLGGDDIDQALADTHNIDRLKAREIKEALSSGEEADGITKEQLAKIAAPFIERTIHIAKNVLVDANLTSTDIEGVVLVGGSTRMPAVHNAVAECFGQMPITELDPDKVVAYGAALQAQALTQGSDTLLMDVTPLSLGLETYGGLVEKIIERNTTIPVSKAQEFTTYKDGQTKMKVHVLQGEREMVADCRSLAEFELSGIPPMKAGLSRIKITFNLDADGLLTVAAEELTTGTQQEIQVKPSYGLPSEAMEKMLEESFKHAKEDIMARILQESRVEAQLLLDSLTGALKEELADYPDIDTQIAKVQVAVEGDNRELIDAEVQKLDKISGEMMEKRLNRALKDVLSGKNMDEAEKLASNE